MMNASPRSDNAAKSYRGGLNSIDYRIQKEKTEWILYSNKLNDSLTVLILTKPLESYVVPKSHHFIDA